MNIEGKLPPQSTELEEYVLGALMIDREAIHEVDFLPSEAFYKDANKKVYEAILSLFNQGLPIDMHTVCEELKRKGTLESVGGMYFVTLLTSSISTSAHVKYHALIVFQKWYARELIRICTETSMAAFGEQTDIEVVKSNLDTALIKLEAFDDLDTEVFVDKLANAVKELKETQERKEKGEMTALPTQLTQLNRMMNGGFRKGDLIVLAGRPAMGKTKVASEFAESMAKHSPGAIFSLEMTTEQLINRMFTKEGALMYNMMNGEMTREDWQAVDRKRAQLSKLYNIAIKDDVYDIHKIGSVARKLKREKLLEWMVIDYLGLLEVSEKTETRNLEIGKITRYLKKLAKQLDIPIILLSQLNRNDAGKRPVLTDLRESGNIEQDADGVIFIHRPCYYNEGAMDESGISWENRGELIIAKYRHGKTGTVVFEHDDNFANIFDYDKQSYLMHHEPVEITKKSWESPRNTYDPKTNEYTPF